jgi:hypothetical protein
VNENSVNITWQPPADSGLPMTYKIYISKALDGINREALPVATSNTNSYIFSNTENNMIYYVEIAAVNARGVGPKSLSWQFQNSLGLPRDINLPPLVAPTTL